MLSLPKKRIITSDHCMIPHFYIPCITIRNFHYIRARYQTTICQESSFTLLFVKLQLSSTKLVPPRHNFLKKVDYNILVSSSSLTKGMFVFSCNDSPSYVVMFMFSFDVFLFLVFSYLFTNVQTFHCDSPRKLPIKKMDPSCTIGFYCANKEEFENFCVKATEVIEICDCRNRPITIISIDVCVSAWKIF